MSDDESFSSTSLDIEIVSRKPTIHESSEFFKQYPFIQQPLNFIDNAEQHYCLVADDLLLGTVLISDYTSIKGNIEKRFKKTLNSMANSITGKIAYLFTSRIMNVPLHDVYQMYKNIDLCFDYYIMVSKLYKVEKADREEVENSFKEYAKVELKYFPYHNEEIFLLDTKIRQNTEVKGNQARICILSKEEFIRFLQAFEKELTP